jgi:NCK-associated protein 1
VLSESNFPRLGQFLLDYESPLKRLHEDFNPIAKGLADALESLRPIVDRRYVTGEALRKDSLLNLLQHSAKV